MKAKYIGDPRNPGEQKQLPDEYEAFGITFERGKFTEVPDHLAPKFEGNSHFETQGKVKEDPEAGRMATLTKAVKEAVTGHPGDPTVPAGKA